MRFFKTLDSINNSEECAVALGLFDGLHKAHQAVIRQAADSGLLPAVFTFAISGRLPASKKEFSLLMSEEKRVEAIRRLGAELILMPDFSEIADISAEDFVVDILFGRMNAKILCCGYDFRFGKGNAGNTDLLKRLCDGHGVKLCVADCISVGGKPVSSSAVRVALADGDMQTYFDMCGRYFAVDSEVIHGNRIGRALSFPTINQPLDPQCLAPRFGVYASVAEVGGKSYTAVTNVGIKPTVSSDNTVLAETNLFGFEDDLYGRQVEVKLMKFLRDEQKFPSLDLLRSAIDRDRQNAKDFFERRT